MQENNSPSIMQRWVLAARPKTLPAAIAPVLVGAGAAFASQSFRWLPVLAAFLTSILIQIGTNLVNDVADYQHGTDDEKRLGPLRVTQAGLLSPRQVWGGVTVTFGMALGLGGYLVWVGGLPILAIGLFCILSAFAYSTGPFPLSRHGWGDLFTMLCFGLAGVCGTAYLAAGFLPATAWLGGVGVGALVTAILIVNNIRDIESDRRAGRRNIPILYGRQAGEIEFLVMLGIAFLVPPLLLISYRSTTWVMVVWLALPSAILLYRKLHSTPIGPAFNLILASTARLVLLYALLLAAGFMLGAVI
jgi:1,4-dihydroxy-2-naphthoate octaprenyltransferase